MDGSKNPQISPSKKRGEHCWARILSWFNEDDLQRHQNMQEGSMEGEEMKQQQRLKAMKSMISKIRVQGRMYASSSW